MSDIFSCISHVNCYIDLLKISQAVNLINNIHAHLTPSFHVDFNKIHLKSWTFLNCFKQTSLLYIHLCDIIKKTRREKNHVDIHKVVENFPAVLKYSIEMFFIFDRVRYTFNSRQITRGCKTCWAVYKKIWDKNVNFERKWSR